jgi:hypothetical protein
MARSPGKKWRSRALYDPAPTDRRTEMANVRTTLVDDEILSGPRAEVLEPDADDEDATDAGDNDGDDTDGTDGDDFDGTDDADGDDA